MKRFLACFVVGLSILTASWTFGAWPVSTTEIPEIMAFPTVDVPRDPANNFVFVFGRPVTNSFYLTKKLAGQQPWIRIWFFLENVGDETKGLLYEPAAPLTGGETWGQGIGFVPGYVGVEVSGFILAIEDIVYKQ